MKTLYDLLDIERNATHVDIERGYRRCLDAYLANKGCGQPDQETLRMQAIREAYLLLSSPTRRQTYDQKLRESAAARYARAAPGGLPLASLMLAVAFLIGGGSYLYKVQQDRTHRAHQVEQADLQAGKAGNRTPADELSRREKEKMERERRAADIRRRQMEQAGSGGQRWSVQDRQVARAD